MEMFRCPTCLTLLDGGEARCPACRSRLGKRSKPIVLGETARIAARQPLPAERDTREREREVRARAVATNAEDRRRRRVADAIDREDTGRVAVLVFVPEPEPQPESADLEAKPANTPDIDLTTKPAPDWSSARELVLEATSGPAESDLHEVFEALHRKARGEHDESPFPIAAANASTGGTRAERLARARSRRHWNFDFRSRHAGGESDDM